MKDSILALINSHGLLFGLLCSLVSFWAGFRSNLWMARRSEWNTVTDRVRATLLRNREYAHAPFYLPAADTDFILTQSSGRQRRHIADALSRQGEICRQYHQDEAGQPIYTAQQQAEMAAIREKLLSLLMRR